MNTLFKEAVKTLEAIKVPSKSIEYFFGYIFGDTLFNRSIFLKDIFDWGSSEDRRGRESSFE